MAAKSQPKPSATLHVFPLGRLVGRARVIAKRSIYVQPKTLDRIWRQEANLLLGVMERAGVSDAEQHEQLTDFVCLVSDLTKEARAARDAKVASMAFLKHIPPEVWGRPETAA